MKIYIGTSGFMYDWNAEGSLDWYVKNSRLNALEINMPFYRFPFPNQVRVWAEKGKSLRWVVKVNRLITHQFKFSERGWQTWKKFKNLFAPLDKNIDFYLFQLPPMLTPNSAGKIARFAKRTKLGKRFALEVRNEKWFEQKWIAWAKKNKITWVSVDAPVLSRDVFKTSDTVYIRMHGRTGWYYHDYSDLELKEVAKRVRAARPKKVYIFFNNNHNMRTNAIGMLKILKR